MTVYHGSNVEVKDPKILKPNRELDFGNGFYTTTNIDQAIAFAKRVTQNRGAGVATVSAYEIDETAVFPLCKVVKFDGVCDAWLDFVCDNRDGRILGQAMILPLDQSQMTMSIAHFTSTGRARLTGKRRSNG